jgi:Protein of unknown function (DUF3179)
MCSAIGFADSIHDLIDTDSKVRKSAAQQILKSKDLRLVPSLIEVAFFYTIKRDRARVDEISKILRELTGNKDAQKYFDWVQWIGKHPEIKPLPEYLSLKREVISIIDPALAQFLENEKSLRIRAEEIVWGGVKKDGIPALMNPPHITANEATYLRDPNHVFGVTLGSESRAYPLRIMDWHEMANDIVGGVQISIPYCTLCGSAIAYKSIYTFGSSGFLYRSNKLMYDRGTGSLWSALSGEPVAGKLVDQGIKLEVLPLVRTTWGEWKRRHPDTTVLDINTGHARDYNKEPYKEYFESNKTMFPVPIEDPRIPLKEFVFAIRLGKIRKAYPLDLLIQNRFLRDDIAEAKVVLVTEPEGKSVRAYRCDAMNADTSWKAEEQFLISPDGNSKCPRLGGHLAYWFGWYAQFPDTELFVFQQ